MKTIVLKVRNLPNNVDIDLFVYCMQQDVAVPYPRGKVELVPDMGEKRDVCEIVRCKDCKFRQSRVSRIIDGKECNLCEMVKGYKPADWFCADGKKR